MTDTFEQIREQIRTGDVTAQSLVLLFGAASEAEERRDVPGLEEALALARQLSRIVEGPLVPEAERLLTLCEESFNRVRADAARPAGAAATAAAAPDRSGECPGCGRPVAADAVRCRACGVLLV